MPDLGAEGDLDRLLDVTLSAALKQVGHHLGRWWESAEGESL